MHENPHIHIDRFTSVKHRQSATTIKATTKIGGLTNHAQNFSIVLRGGGSSYVAASTSFRPDWKSISIGGTGEQRYQKREPT